MVTEAEQGDPEFSSFPGACGPVPSSLSGSQPRNALPILVGWALPGCPGVRGGSPWYQESCFVNQGFPGPVPPLPFPPTLLPESVQLRPCRHACWAPASQELTSMRRPGRSSRSLPRPRSLGSCTPLHLPWLPLPPRAAGAVPSSVSPGLPEPRGRRDGGGGERSTSCPGFLLRVSYPPGLPSVSVSDGALGFPVTAV